MLMKGETKMIVTKKYNKRIKRKIIFRYIKDKLGKDPGPDYDGCEHEYTEQDIWEQVRKIISDN